MPRLVSPHFTLAELTITQQVDQAGVLIPNNPNAEQLRYLTKLATTILEPIRTLWDCPVYVSSAFRCEAVEIKVSGKAYGQHMLGQAADIVPFNHHLSMKDAYERILHSELPYDQLLFEYGRWIHVSCAPDERSARRQALMIGAWTQQKWAIYESKLAPTGLV